MRDVYLDINYDGRKYRPSQNRDLIVGDPYEGGCIVRGMGGPMVRGWGFTDDYRTIKLRLKQVC